jgi:hypothetical protein
MLYAKLLGMKKLKRIPITAFLAAAALALCAWASLKTIDDIGKDPPKGYVSFYSPQLHISVTEAGKRPVTLKNSDFWRLYPELRIARPPGRYFFTLAHRNYSASFEVEVLPERISYVSVDMIYLSRTSDRSYMYGQGATVTTATYHNVWTSLGATPLPLVPGGGNAAEIITALDDGDWATRLFAIRALEQAKRDPGPEGISRLKAAAVMDRKQDVREAAQSLLAALGEETPPKITTTGGTTGTIWTAMAAATSTAWATIWTTRRRASPPRQSPCRTASRGSRNSTWKPRRCGRRA